MRIAAFTMAKDECEFLPIWIDYYGREFGVENLFVLNDGSEDGSCDSLPCTVVNLSLENLDELRRASLVSNFNSFLLEMYDVVLFCDVDELIVPDPSKWEDLRRFIECEESQLIAGVGLALLHIRDKEEKWQPGSLILKQRSYVAFHGAHCKPAISRRPVKWRAGFHSAFGDYQINLNLYMFHLKSMDYELSHNILLRRQRIKMSKDSLRLNHGVQFRYTKDRFDDFYFKYTSRDIDNICRKFDFEEDVAEVFIKKTKSASGFGKIRGIPDRFQTKF